MVTSMDEIDVDVQFLVSQVTENKTFQQPYLDQYFLLPGTIENDEKGKYVTCDWLFSHPY